MKYSEITLEQAYLLKDAYCDGDKQRISLNTMEEALEQLKKAIEPIAKTICDIFSKLIKQFSNIFDNIGNYKITKKRFKKLLQSDGYQRNEINKIVKEVEKGNKSYTYYLYMKYNKK